MYGIRVAISREEYERQKKEISLTSKVAIDINSSQVKQAILNAQHLYEKIASVQNNTFKNNV